VNEIHPAPSPFGIDTGLIQDVGFFTSPNTGRLLELGPQ
jgi:hypothetical protein